MCMYSAVDGIPNEWHMVHLGSFARGGAGLVMVEATGITPEGRITPGCTGMWSADHVSAFRPITRFIEAQGAVPGIQLSHSGRKGSTSPLWEGGHWVAPEAGGWATMGPSAIAFSGLPEPRAMTQSDIDGVIRSFVEAAGRAVSAGFKVIELHAAHGYLLHQFLSPLSNHRDDHYGGSLSNRIRLTLEVATAVRQELGAQIPLFVRLSATDWVDGGWTLDESVVLGTELKQVDVDLIDCSSGALISVADIDVHDGYQVPFARRIRAEAGIATSAVGLITTAAAAQEVVASQAADAVFLGRALLRNPHWPLLAAEELGQVAPWPVQYGPAARRRRDV